MKSKSITPIRLVLGVLLALLTTVKAEELPPASNKLLSEILKSVEMQKLGVISEAEYDDGLWEVNVCDAFDCQKLYIDPWSGEEKRRRNADSEEMPPATAMPLSMIVQSVEARKLGRITEIEFDDGFWEIELRKNGRMSKLVIDPRTGMTSR